MSRHTHIRIIVLVVFILAGAHSLFAQFDPKEGGGVRLPGGMQLPDTQTETPPTEKKDTIVEIEHAFRIGVDLLSLASPFISGEGNSGWMVMSDYRLTPKTYLALDFGQSKRTFDFSQQMVSVDGWFMRAGADFTLMRGIFTQDDMIFAGAKLGHSRYTRHIYGAKVDGDYWGDSSPIELKDKAQTTWIDLSMGVMVRLFAQVYLSMSGSYDVIVASSKPNNIKPMAVPGIGQVYNSGTGFSFSYAISYRIPLYKKKHTMKIKVATSNQELIERENANKKKEALAPTFTPEIVLEE